MNHVVNTYTTYALSKWSKQSKDREFLEKLYATVFSKFQHIISRLSEVIPFSHHLRTGTMESLRRFPTYRIDLNDFRDVWSDLRDNRLDTTEFDDLMKTVWKISHDVLPALDEDERAGMMAIGWKKVLENRDKY